MRELKIVGDHITPQLLSHSEIENWSLTVRTPREVRVFTLNQLKAIGAQQTSMFIECVSAGFIAGGRHKQLEFTGLPLAQLMVMLDLSEEVQTVIFRSRADAWGGPSGEKHETALELEYCKNPNVLLAWGMDGEDLPLKNGGPLRSTVGPDRYFYKAMKWLTELEFTARPLEECRGTWETYGGYHNVGRTGQTPEERFEPIMRWITDVDANGKDVSEIIPPTRWLEVFEQAYTDGDLSRMILAKAELMGIDLNRSFKHIRFVNGPFQAKVRGSEFSKINFSGVDFQKVNFSLCKFPKCLFSDEGAHPANLSYCDMEGAHLESADLRGVNMKGAYLTGVHFYLLHHREENQKRKPANVKGLDLREAINLDPFQAQWLKEDGALLP